jgi:hypothetical protein
MIPRIIVAIVIVAIGIDSVHGEGRWVLGHGLSLCSAWTEARKTYNVDQIPMEHWVAGYLSEANFVGPDLQAPDIPDLLKGEDWTALTTWIDNYCAAHPVNQLYAAANALVVELTSRHPAPPSKPEEKH